jgi:hypothetical protein
MAGNLGQAVGGAHRIYALPLYFIGIVSMTADILLSLHSLSATRNFAY